MGNWFRYLSSVPRKWNQCVPSPAGWKLSAVIDPSLWSLICLAWLVFSIAYFPALPPTLGSTPVKTWKVINKCPLCCRTNTDGIWLTHGGLAEPWAGRGSRQPLYKELQACVGVRIFLKLWVGIKKRVAEVFLMNPHVAREHRCFHS